MKIIQVAIADDNALALKSIVEKLSAFDDIGIVFCAANGASLLDQLARHPVDIVFMDIEMPVMDGITTTRKVSEDFPEVKVIMLTTFDDSDKIFNAILAGAAGYLLKEESAETIYRHATETLRGGAAMSAGIAFKVVQYIKNNATTGQQIICENLLSSREIEILMEIKNGLTYKQIAEKFYISEGTVRKHIENIYRKLQVTNKVSALNVATDKKWIH